jgi:hypothetical protein
MYRDSRGGTEADRARVQSKVQPEIGADLSHGLHDHVDLAVVARGKPGIRRERGGHNCKIDVIM